ncbi:MAG: sodium/proton-translocating pyrophosphatase, partial [Clostridium sp.]
MELLIIPLVCGISALIVLFFMSKDILKKDPGDEKMVEIATHIEEGAMAFIKKEYSYLLVFIVIVFTMILVFLNYQTALAFCFGAIFSMLAGFIGMKI